ncbi:MAG: hypothetical protein ACON38_06700, partial [Akkermansiaceae bacterium]
MKLTFKNIRIREIAKSARKGSKVRHQEEAGNRLMKTSGTDRLMVSILCGIAFWSTAVIANANEEKASEIIKLWPKDGASQDNEGMGTPKPDLGDGHIRLTDITQPSLRYFPAPGKKKPGPAVILCPGGG